MSSKLFFIVISTIALTSPSVANAEVYQVYVKRIDKDLYKTSEGMFIETQYCYHYTYGEDAILKYEPYSYDNKIIFDNDQSCTVKRIFK